MRTPNLPLVSLPIVVSLWLAAACGGGGDDAASADAGPQCGETFYADSDGDGYGDDSSAQEACEAPAGFVAQGGDCDDDNANAHPGRAEVCDGSDNDCNGLTDSADPSIDLSTERLYFLDSDGDGYGVEFGSVTSCDQPAGYVPDATDCDDNRSDVNPGATEVCDGFDNDCDDQYDDDDSTLDASTASTYYVDSDGDGYGVGAAVLACSAPNSHATQDGDCNDAEAAANPGASEVCDGLDNDCDGGIDGTTSAPNQCGAYPGTFSGAYSIRAQEKLGSTVINDMRCVGTMSLTIDLAADPAVAGTVSCNRIGGLILFDSTQTGTITGDIDLEGNISATLRHNYNDSVARNYSVSSVIVGDSLDFAGMGSVLPHPMSAVPWEVTYAAESER